MNDTTPPSLGSVIGHTFATLDHSCLQYSFCGVYYKPRGTGTGFDPSYTRDATHSPEALTYPSNSWTLFRGKGSRELIYCRRSRGGVKHSKVVCLPDLEHQRDVRLSGCLHEVPHLSCFGTGRDGLPPVAAPDTTSPTVLLPNRTGVTSEPCPLLERKRPPPRVCRSSRCSSTYRCWNRPELDSLPLKTPCAYA